MNKIGMSYVPSDFRSVQIAQSLHRCIQKEEFQLTTREMEVLECLSKGLTSRQCAARLYISLNTIKSHRKSLLRKLNANNMFILAKNASRAGLI